jgi:acyl-CoA reductase-like NAD-dependent aldehyde dehydrogenase
MTLEHTCLEINSLEDADTAIAFARMQSNNWGRGGSKQHSRAIRRCHLALRNKAHAFIRLILIDRQKGCLSMLHIVDLAGVLPTFPPLPGTWMPWPCLQTRY